MEPRTYDDKNHSLSVMNISKVQDVKPINNIFNLDLDIKPLLQNARKRDAGNSELFTSITTAWSC